MRPTRSTNPQPSDWARIREQAGLLDRLSVAPPLELVKHGGIGIRLQQMQPFLGLVTTPPGGHDVHYDYRYWVRRAKTTKIPAWWWDGVGEDEFEASVDTAYGPVQAVNLAERWKEGTAWVGSHLLLEGTAVMVHPTKDVYGNIGFYFHYPVACIMRAKVTNLSGMEGKILRNDDTEYPAGHPWASDVTIYAPGRGPGGTDGLFPPVKINDVLFVFRFGNPPKWYFIPWWSLMGNC